MERLNKKNTQNTNIPVVVMNFSGVYEREHFYENREVLRIDGKEIPGTNCYCDEGAQNLLRERIRELPPEGIHFIDSGNYHYMSCFWLEKIKEPFCLLVFDNHTDMQPPAFGGLLSCGGWIAEALERLPHLSQVLLIGPTEEAVRQTEGAFGQRVCILTRERLKQAGEIMGAGEGVPEKIFSGLPVYISLDKDILSREEVCVNWDQGEMSLDELKKWISVICTGVKSAGAQILGADICGEDGADRPESLGENDRVNGVLLDLLKGYLE